MITLGKEQFQWSNCSLDIRFLMEGTERESKCKLIEKNWMSKGGERLWKYVKAGFYVCVYICMYVGE